MKRQEVHTKCLSLDQIRFPGEHGILSPPMSLRGKFYMFDGLNNEGNALIHGPIVIPRKTRRGMMLFVHKSYLFHRKHEEDPYTNHLSRYVSGKKKLYIQGKYVEINNIKRFFFSSIPTYKVCVIK